MAWVECEYPQTAPEIVEPTVVELTPVTASAVVSNEFDIVAPEVVPQDSED
jgi:hypothetical protein